MAEAWSGEVPGASDEERAVRRWHRSRGGPDFDGTVWSGEVPGASDEERAVRVAGTLAEAGIGVLWVRAPGKEAVELRARSADLPGVLREATVGTVVEAHDGRVRVTIERGRWVWWTGDEELARRLGGAR